jgi:HlyD family secretion protein
MKSYFSLLSLVVLLVSSCSTDKNKPDAYGTFEATEVTVSSQANGRILWLTIEEGQELDSGKVVGIIDTIDLSLKKYQVLAQRDATASRKADLEAQIAVFQQNKSNALVDKDRIEKLLKDGAATRKQLDDVNAALNVTDKQIASVGSQFAGLRDQVEGLQLQADQISKSIHDARIVNPVKGTVLTKFAEANEITTYGKPVYKIADLTSLNLRVYISGAQLSHIKTGQHVQVRFDQDEKNNSKTEGVVTWISPTAEFTPKTIQTKEERVNLVYAVKVRVKNDGRLKIGMPGEIKFMNQ